MAKNKIINLYYNLEIKISQENNKIFISNKKNLLKNFYQKRNIANANYIY